VPVICSIAARGEGDEHFVPDTETIQNIENGKCKPMPATLEKIGNSFADHGVSFIGDQKMQGVVLIQTCAENQSGKD
jgi:hypothetical protein